MDFSIWDTVDRDPEHLVKEHAGLRSNLCSTTYVRVARLRHSACSILVPSLPPRRSL